MPKMKRLVVASIKSTACNMRCGYCYIGADGEKPVVLPKFTYSVEHMAKALSRERLGGTCLIHLISGGETLLAPESVPFARKMLEEGHFVYIVTNMILRDRIEALLAFPPELLKRLVFHPSFHFLELRRLAKMEEYFENIRMALKAGCSCVPSFVLNETYMPHLEEIKELWMRQLGDLPQVTPVRNVTREDLPVNFPGLDRFIQEGAFNSLSFHVTKQLENVKRTEFCYAGDWAFLVNLLNGDLSKCTCSPATQNIFEDLSKPIVFEAEGKCRSPWCLCGPTFLSFGMIPELDLPNVTQTRGRDPWMNPEAKDFLSGRLYESNASYGPLRKWWVVRGKNKVQHLAGKLHLSRQPRTAPGRR